jgi:hypothetical protein
MFPHGFDVETWLGALAVAAFYIVGIGGALSEGQ